MRKIAPLCMSVFFCCSVLQAKNPAKPANFSGNWELDLGQTKNLPPGLESYSMFVSQNGQQLKVETSFKGDIRPVGVLPGPYPGSSPGSSPNGYPGGSRGRMGGMGRMGMPGGGMGRPAGAGVPGLPGGSNGSGGGGIGEEGRSQKSAAAFMFYPSRAAYELDGGKTTARLGGPMHTDATLKAVWAKRGKELKLSLDGNQYSGPGGGDILLKEQWEFSKDGHSLIVDRALHSPRGSTTLHLVFHKEGVTPNGA